MGAKITIDSSTLMNKGLEVIEAHELFDVDYDQVSVVVHPQSVVHGMVEFCDGAVIAQLSMPDMRLPIGLALGAPGRLDEPFGAIDWSTLGSLDLRDPGSGGLPLPGPGLRGRPDGRRRPGRALGRQRGGGGGLPGPADPLGHDRRTSTARWSATWWAAATPGTFGTSQTFSKLTGSRASGLVLVVDRVGKAA